MSESSAGLKSNLGVGLGPAIPRENMPDIMEVQKLLAKNPDLAEVVCVSSSLCSLMILNKIVFYRLGGCKSSYLTMRRVRSKRRSLGVCAVTRCFQIPRFVLPPHFYPYTFTFRCFCSYFSPVLYTILMSHLMYASLYASLSR